MNFGAVSLPMVFLWQVSDDNPQKVAGPVSTSVYSPWRNRWPCTSLLWGIIHLREWLQTSWVYYTCKLTFVGRTLYQDLLRIRWFAVTNFSLRRCCLSQKIYSGIRDIKELVHSEKWEPSESFLQVNKSWFTVYACFVLLKKSNDQ